MRRSLNKRGDLTDIILFVVIAFFLAVSFIVVIYANNIIKDEVIAGTELGNTSAASSILDSFATINQQTVQRGYAMMMGLLLISVVASAFMVRLHPAFSFIYIIVLGFTIFVSIFISNAYYEISQDSELGSVVSDNPMITFFLENLVLIVLVTGALSLIVAFSKIFPSLGVGGADV